MNYELAKKLRDAGFPQETREGNQISDGEAAAWNEKKGKRIPTMGNWAYDPILPELIEEIFKVAHVGGFHLHCGFDSFKTYKWDASVIQAIDSSIREGLDFEITDASDPKEALANLYLALRKK